MFGLLVVSIQKYIYFYLLMLFLTILQSCLLDLLVFVNI